MAKTATELALARGGAETPARRAGKAPRCLSIAKVGVRSGRDFAQMMSALMSDLIEGRIDARAANAVCNASGKLLKVVEMEHRYGRKSARHVARTLELAP